MSRSHDDSFVYFMNEIEMRSHRVTLQQILETYVQLVSDKLTYYKNRITFFFKHYGIQCNAD